MPATLYGKAQANFLGGEAGGDTFQSDVLTDTIRVMLCTSTYTPAPDTHETKTDVTNEVSGTGYTARGVALASKTITVTAADSWGTSRANTTAYVVGDVVRPATPNGHLYRCIVAGTSAGAPPTFPTVSGQTVADGSVTWAEIGRIIVQFDAADPSWGPGATITGIRYAVIYRDTGTDGTSPLFGYIDFSSDQAVNNGTFTIQLAALGIHNWTSP